MDLGRVRELRGVVRWSADPRAFDLLRGMREARWAVAEAPGGALAGMVGAVPLGAVGILCHLAVHDAYRRLGIGGALSRWAVVYLRSRGALSVRLDATERAVGLYRALGFEPVYERVTYRLEEAVGASERGRWSDSVARGYRLGTLVVGDLPEVIGLDHWSYGADRSALILATLRLHPGGGLVARDATGRVGGYLLRSASGSGGGSPDRVTRLGPFAAASPGVARLLLGAALADTAGGPVEATVPGPGGSPAHDLFAGCGFVGRAERLRMQLGEAPDPGGLVHYGTTPYLAT
jgi:ribosomal protein S18 acetylase RimI-like enzyme